MKNHKIIFIFFLILSFTLFIYPITTHAKSLTVWISWEGNNKYEEIAKLFKNQEGIDIKIVYVPKIYQKIKTVAKGGGELPDIALLRNTYIGELAKEGIVKPIPKTLETGISEKGKIAFSYDKKLFGIPFYFDAQVIYYNPWLLKRAKIEKIGPSWTLADLEKYGKMLKQLKGITPLAWGAYSPYFFGGFEYSFRKDCIKCERIQFFTSATEKAILYYKKLIKEGIGVSMDRNAFLSGFKRGKIGFIIFGTFILPNFIKEGVSFGTLPLPINPETTRRVASYLDYKGFISFKNIKENDNVYKFLTFLKKKKVQFDFCNPLYKFPDNPDALSSVLSKNKYLSPLKETVQTGIIAPKEPIYLYYNKALSNVLKLILVKNVPINKAFTVGKKYLKGKEK